MWDQPTSVKEAEEMPSHGLKLSGSRLGWPTVPVCPGLRGSRNMGLSISKQRKISQCGISWSLVKTTVRYAMLKENHKAQSGQWGQSHRAGGRATMQRLRKSGMDHILPQLTISYALHPDPTAAHKESIQLTKLPSDTTWGIKVCMFTSSFGSFQNKISSASKVYTENSIL